MAFKIFLRVFLLPSKLPPVVLFPPKSFKIGSIVSIIKVSRLHKSYTVILIKILIKSNHINDRYYSILEPISNCLP